MTNDRKRPKSEDARNLYQGKRRPPVRSPEQLEAWRVARDAKRKERADKGRRRKASLVIASSNADVAARRLAVSIEAGHERSALLASVVQSERESHAAALVAWDHKAEGTPETHQRASLVRQSPLSRMLRLGKISVDEFASALEISDVIEAIEGDVSVAASSLERVDYSSAGKDALVEGLKRVRMEVAYTHWRETLPEPKRMILDLVLANRGSYVALAVTHGLPWRIVRKRMLTALRKWPAFKEFAWKMVDRETLDAAVADLVGDVRR